MGDLSVDLPRITIKKDVCCEWTRLGVTNVQPSMRKRNESKGPFKGRKRRKRHRNDMKQRE
jgi:hypothetical protein